MFRIFVFMAQGCFKVSVMALLRFWVGVWDLACRVCFAFTAWGLSCSTCLDIQRVPTQYVCSSVYHVDIQWVRGPLGEVVLRNAAHHHTSLPLQ